MILFWPCTLPAAVLLISQGAHKDNNVVHGIVCGLQMTLGFHRSYSCSSFLGEGRAVRTEVEKVLPVVLRLKVELEKGVAESEAKMPEGVKEGGAALLAVTCSAGGGCREGIRSARGRSCDAFLFCLRVRD